MADDLDDIDALEAPFPDTPDAPMDRILECVAVRCESPDVKTFVLRDTARDAPRFAAGQSMLLTLDIDGERVDRTFSIASAPSTVAGDKALELTLKRQPAGRVTRWLHDELSPGMHVRSRYPLGVFRLDAMPQGPLALVSAGSGASPLMSMLRTLARHAPKQDVAWFHAARRVEDILFADEIATLQARMPKLQASVTLSLPGPGWFGLRGRVSRRLIAAAMPDFFTREVYCCGPTSFMDDVRRIHAADGARHARFHVEHFGAPTVSTSPADRAASDADTDTRFDVTLGDKHFTARAGETVLMAASRQQVVISCGCASGICGTCKLHKRSGAVEMHHQGGLSPHDEAKGFILACSSRPLSDLVLDF
ncbi:flavin reductase family protein [Caballeronia sordidicola]|uniref:Flavodoxin reductases (Ferredoxin-NADPH reductases) family 1 n=1 Tax=Caballeronia sordidicola TaxID=196367 RepID=A0A226WPE5_CABSO|nr:2Fe-2S iron-sulfur cluster-binding protein [Caballeronia sordidicola]OXC73056.1 Flavodoxin reductases (ferredoxin-NADPH reductases) family 1 [Caballeronia sordidicola]